METITIDCCTLDSHSINVLIEHDNDYVHAVGSVQTFDMVTGKRSAPTQFEVHLDHAGDAPHHWALHVHPLTTDAVLHHSHPEPADGYEVLHQATVYVANAVSENVGEDLSNG